MPSWCIYSRRKVQATNKKYDFKKLMKKWLTLDIFSSSLGIDQPLSIEQQENLLNVKTRPKVIHPEAQLQGDGISCKEE